MEDSLSIAVFNTLSTQEKSSTELNGYFVQSQLLIDVLLRMKASSTDKHELISWCKEEYKDNTTALAIILDFEHNYSSDRAVWWYTRESFLYRTLNKALRVQNIDLLFLFRFFLRDLRQQLKQHQLSSSIRVYRAQLISKEELEIMKQSIGQYLSMNSFLSTSVDRQLALFLLGDYDSSDDSVRVLFEIDLDAQVITTKPFADVTSLSYFSEEQEVLIMLGSIFRLENIYMEENRIWIIRMTLSSENDQDFKTLFEYMKKQYQDGETGLLSFGDSLWRMGKFDDAEKYYRRMLNELPYDHEDIAICYYTLGLVASAKGKFDSSLEWHHKSLEIKIRKLGLNHPSLAASYNSIGVVYRQKGDNKKALESYRQALIVYQQNFGEDHPRIATCFNNMGNIYNAEKNYAEALQYHKMALPIYEKHRPPEHPDLGAAHNSIGSVYGSLGEYNLALEHFNLSLKIYEKSLPPHHPHIAMTLENIGLIYEDNDDLQQALLFYTKAATIFRHSLPATHPRIVEIEQDIQRISSDHE
ncbi:unnamed protein product [Rotaria sordida]|uniref:ADP ribosyltransferase domain-containing protein n=1 Tax=Rotaria sordida TaxID=392033 RepID=A0A815C1A6_9BILA|nr:unnamed protein product [Rotaria sordida]CAF4052411.1 unnamed protein product [Rotaria sordida]